MIVAEAGVVIRLMDKVAEFAGHHVQSVQAGGGTNPQAAGWISADRLNVVTGQAFLVIGVMPENIKVSAGLAESSQATALGTDPKFANNVLVNRGDMGVRQRARVVLIGFVVDEGSSFGVITVESGTSANPEYAVTV